MLRHSLTNVLSNSARKWRRRAHTRTNEGDGLPRAFFALGGARARRSLGTTEGGGEHARSSCAPRGPGPTLPFSLSSIRKGGRRMAKCRLLFPPSFLSLSLPRPVSTSCRPRKVGKYFLLALFPDPTTATADFHVPPERRAVSITPSPFLPLR